jgi:hypothetical protein
MESAGMGTAVENLFLNIFLTLKVRVYYYSSISQNPQREIEGP